jgi:hypothetical protein
MDRLRALEKDYDPGGGRVATLISIFRCTVYRCPYCRWIFKVTWGPSNALLGGGERPCWHCKRVFWDGSNEWPEMSGDNQRHFLFPITIVGFIGAFVLIPVLTLWTSFFAKMPVRLEYGLSFLVFGIPLALWFGIRALQINRSIRRYNDRGKTRPV